MIGNFEDHQSSSTRFLQIGLAKEKDLLLSNSIRIFHKFGTVNYQHQMCEMNFSLVHDVNQSTEELSTDLDIVLKEPVK